MRLPVASVKTHFAPVTGSSQTPAETSVKFPRVLVTVEALRVGVLPVKLVRLNKFQLLPSVTFAAERSRSIVPRKDREPVAAPETELLLPFVVGDVASFPL